MLISGIRAQGIKQHSNSRFNHHSRKSALDKKQRMKKLIDGMEQFGQDFLFRSFRRVHDPGNKDKDVYMVLEIRMKDICNIILDIRIQQIEMKTANNKLHTMEQIQEEKTRRRNKKIGRTQRLKEEKKEKKIMLFFEKRKMKADSKILIQRCYLDYLEALVSHYKAARSSRNPTGGYEGIRRFEDYHGDGNMDGSLAAKEKGRVEHFGITLKEEEEGKHKLMHTSYCQ
ncbi:hypothetical protein Tco_0952992 [Tanacetum coccineum]|uniref:Uncharacterized protein n=2 Tax=Tanacetum coccineum TaxID=301880 RepID=A0ABQ5DYL0_9ASTR